MSAITGIFSSTLTQLSLPGTEAQVRINQQRALFVRLTDDTGAYVAPGGGTTDESAWTAGASSFSPTGGAFNDSAAALTSGQQGTARQTANRALHVNVRDHLGNEATLTGNSLNVNVTNAASGGTAAVDEASATAGASQFTPIGGVFNDTFTALTSGQMGLARLTSTRGLHVFLDNASIAVTGTFFQATQPISAVSLPLPTGAALDASVTGLQVAQGSTTSGQKGGLALGAVTTSPPAYTTAQSSPLSLDTTGNLRVAVLNTPAVSQSGTWNIGTVTTVSAVSALTSAAATAKFDIGLINAVTPLMGNGITGTGSLRVTIASDNTAFSVNAVQSGTWNVGTVTTLTSITNAVTVSQATAANLQAQVQGTVANASADSGNPQKIGGVYTSAAKTALTTGNRGDAMIGSQGELIMQGLAPVAWFGVQATTITASVSETTIVTAGAAGVFNDLVLLVVTNSSATAVTVTLKDATAGTTRGIFAIAANGGIVIPWHHRLAQAAAAANWTITSSGSVTSLFVHAHFVTRK